MLRKLLTACLLVAISVGIEQAQATNIAVSFTLLNDPYLAMVRDSIVAEAKKTANLQLEVVEANNDVPHQLDQIRGMIAKKPDAMLVFISDSGAGQKVNEMAVAAQIPVVYLLGIPAVEKLPTNAAIVTSNGYVAGRLQMLKLAALMNGQGNLVILRGVDANTDTKGRTQGVKEIVAKWPNIHVIDEGSANWKRQEADKLVTDWLAKGDKIDAIAANNDEMALGALDALDRAKLSKVLVAGVDGSPGGLAAMQQGKMALTVLQNARAQGAKAVQDALNLIQKQTVPQFDWVPFELVTKEVLPSYLNK